MPSINKTFGDQIRLSPSLTVSLNGQLDLSNATIDLRGSEFIDGVWSVVQGANNLSNSPATILCAGSQTYTVSQYELRVTLRRT